MERKNIINEKAPKGRDVIIHENAETENAEDETKYGEFVCTYFAWLPPQSQKEKAKELNEMTKKGGTKKDGI